MEERIDAYYRGELEEEDFEELQKEAWNSLDQELKDELDDDLDIQGFEWVNEEVTSYPWDGEDQEVSNYF